MTNLRTYAQGKPCFLRVPEICTGGGDDGTVLCHLRMIGISGFGLKAPDIVASFGCGPCHDFVDNRSHPHNTYEYRRTLLLEGMARTLNYLVEHEIVEW